MRAPRMTGRLRVETVDGHVWVVGEGDKLELRTLVRDLEAGPLPMLEKDALTYVRTLRRDFLRLHRHLATHHDSPPDELNRAETAGLHFGYPWFGGGTDRTPDFAGDTPPAGARPPVVAFGAHVAALGVHHYRGAMFPAEMRTDALVAQHGSWNRSVPDGYRVVRVHMDPDGTVRGYAPFIEGWLGPDGRAFGRPVDLAELPDGSLLISDDRAGVLYRVTYRAP